MQAASRLVIVAIELAASVKDREDRFQRRLLRLGMFVDGDSTSIVGYGDRSTVLVQGDRDLRRMAIHRLIDRVVNDLPDQMVEASHSHATDVHTGAFANGLESFQDNDVFALILLGR